MEIAAAIMNLRRDNMVAVVFTGLFGVLGGLGLVRRRAVRGWKIAVVEAFEEVDCA